MLFLSIHNWSISVEISCIIKLFDLFCLPCLRVSESVVSSLQINKLAFSVMPCIAFVAAVRN